MHLIVVGAGAAGLTAAFRLQQAGHDVTVLERAEVVGGRTHSEHHGPGHWSDTGAGWLASFYPRTLALLDEIGQRDRLRPMALRGKRPLDRRQSCRSQLAAVILASPLPRRQGRVLRYASTLLARQPATWPSTGATTPPARSRAGLWRRSATTSRPLRSKGPSSPA